MTVAAASASTMLVLFLASLLCFGSTTVGGSRPPPKAWPQLVTPKKNSSASISSKDGVNFYDSDAKTLVHWGACQSDHGAFHGLKGTFSVHPVQHVSSGQTVSAHLWLSARDSNDMISAGWHVQPDLYGDNLVHFFTLWTRDHLEKTGCFNLDCPGFVVSEGSLVVPGTILISVDEITISIRRESLWTNWRLFFGDIEVGMWPNSLFPRLCVNAEVVSAGGRVEFPNGTIAPAMGNGHFPGSPAGSAFVKQLQFYEPLHGRFADFTDQLHIYNDAEDCYGAVFIQGNTAGEQTLDLHYGGPRGCTNYN